MDNKRYYHSFKYQKKCNIKITTFRSCCKVSVADFECCKKEENQSSGSLVIGEMSFYCIFVSE